jgi:hypothetical protein
MNNETRERYLKLALVVFGVVFWLIYPLGLLWPSGWVWHGGEGSYYLQMICGIYAVLGIFLIAAARNPAENRSLISFPSGRRRACGNLALQALFCWRTWPPVGRVRRCSSWRSCSGFFRQVRGALTITGASIDFR